MSKTILLVVNFGGPRDVSEVFSFLEALLTDRDVIRTPLPSFLQNMIFRRIARKRSVAIAEDYKEIGGRSPIFADTEWMTEELEKRFSLPCLAFHRYLPNTHASFLHRLHQLQPEEILVFPLFPQFSYATTGSIARWLSSHVESLYVKRMRWVKSYSGHKAYIRSFISVLQEFLKEKEIEESEALLLFSAHGLPVSFIEGGDVYRRECEESFSAIRRQFPKAKSKLSYQSKFGRGQWLEPSTLDLCQNPTELIEEKKHIVLLPLSFTSDHIETLFEIEELYVKPMRNQGFSAHRCPALGRREDWVVSVQEIIEDANFVSTQMLIRK